MGVGPIQGQKTTLPKMDDGYLPSDSQSGWRSRGPISTEQLRSIFLGESEKPGPVSPRDLITVSFTSVDASRLERASKNLADLMIAAIQGDVETDRAIEALLKRNAPWRGMLQTSVKYRSSLERLFSISDKLEFEAQVKKFYTAYFTDLVKRIESGEVDKAAVHREFIEMQWGVASTIIRMIEVKFGEDEYSEGKHFVSEEAAQMRAMFLMLGDRPLHRIVDIVKPRTLREVQAGGGRGDLGAGAVQSFSQSSMLPFETREGFAPEAPRLGDKLGGMFQNFPNVFAYAQVRTKRAARRPYDEEGQRRQRAQIAEDSKVSWFDEMVNEEFLDPLKREIFNAFSFERVANRKKGIYETKVTFDGSVLAIILKYSQQYVGKNLARSLSIMAEGLRKISTTLNEFRNKGVQVQMPEGYSLAGDASLILQIATGIETKLIEQGLISDETRVDMAVLALLFWANIRLDGAANRSTDWRLATNLVFHQVVKRWMSAGGTEAVEQFFGNINVEGVEDDFDADMREVYGRIDALLVPYVGREIDDPSQAEGLKNVMSMIRLILGFGNYEAAYLAERYYAKHIKGLFGPDAAKSLFLDADKKLEIGKKIGIVSDRLAQRVAESDLFFQDMFSSADDEAFSGSFMQGVAEAYSPSYPVLPYELSEGEFFGYGEKPRIGDKLGQMNYLAPGVFGYVQDVTKYLRTTGISRTSQITEMAVIEDAPVDERKSGHGRKWREEVAARGAVASPSGLNSLPLFAVKSVKVFGGR